uniref:Uncharacterized protein n=1 Tax=Ananas comosus var. bracteatus TaxID=296719 RepID=A0A6V7NVD1_ANACO|nr:unnamed protein product [Ananas comosus var. bracteatus]
MAIRCSTPSAFTPRKDSKTMIKAFKLHSVHTQRNKANDSIKHFAVTNKVFENQQMGIVCYRDKHGEVICEGFDEGPRLSRENSGGDNHQREPQISECQMEKLPQILDADFQSTQSAAVRRKN